MGCGAAVRLVMDDTEIAIHYKLAANKARDIKVLAQLCGTTEREIRSALEQVGITPCGARARKPPTKITAQMESAMYRLYADGLYDGEIAEKVGASETSVCRWRRRNGLPSNYGGKGGRIRWAVDK